MAISKDYGKYTPRCDACGDALETEESFEEARSAMKEANWTTQRVEDYWVNFCPTCQEEEI